MSLSGSQSTRPAMSSSEAEEDDEEDEEERGVAHRGHRRPPTLQPRVETGHCDRGSIIGTHEQAVAWLKQLHTQL